MKLKWMVGGQNPWFEGQGVFCVFLDIGVCLSLFSLFSLLPLTLSTHSLYLSFSLSSLFTSSFGSYVSGHLKIVLGWGFKTKIVA